MEPTNPLKGLVFYSRGDLVHRLRGDPVSSVATTLCGRKAFVGEHARQVSLRRKGHGCAWLVDLETNPVSCLACQRSSRRGR